MEKDCRVSYNNIDDSLILSCKEENENIKERFMFDDIIFYLTGRGKIVGLQLLNASQFLAESGVNEEVLLKLKQAELVILPKQNSLFIGIRLLISNQLRTIPLGRVFIPQLVSSK